MKKWTILAALCVLGIELIGAVLFVTVFAGFLTWLPR